MWYYSTSSSFILLLFTQHIFWLLFNIILGGSDWVCLLLVKLRFHMGMMKLFLRQRFFFVHAFFFDTSPISALPLAGHWHQITYHFPHLSFWVNDITCGPNRSEAFQCFFFWGIQSRLKFRGHRCDIIQPFPPFILQSLNAYIGSMFIVIVVS